MPIIAVKPTDHSTAPVTSTIFASRNPSGMWVTHGETWPPSTVSSNIVVRSKFSQCFNDTPRTS
jgi:hypothetical protein